MTRWKLATKALEIKDRLSKPSLPLKNTYNGILSYIRANRDTIINDRALNASKGSKFATPWLKATLMPGAESPAFNAANTRIIRPMDLV